MTAAIAAAIYPEAEIRPVGFETVRDRDGSFDLAIGNVPFGKYRLHDPVFNREALAVHNHFAVKSLRLVKPGGLVAVVTSRYTLDARNPAPRRALYEHGDLLAAIRLPNGAHQAIAGTQVLTDVLVLRRRHDGEPPRPFDWEATTLVDLDGVEARVNAWFAGKGPGVVVGRLRTGRGMYGDGEVMVDSPAEGLAAALSAVVGRLAPALAGCYDPAPAAPAPPRTVTADRDELAVGELAVTDTGMLTEHTVGGAVRVQGLSRPMTARMVALVRLRDQARTVMALQRHTADSDVVRAWDAARLRLNDVYDAYVARWGPVNVFELTAAGGRRYATPSRFRKDPGWGLVAALEVFDPSTQTAQKAAIFTQWLATPERRFAGAEDPIEALATSLAAGRGVDTVFIGELLACDPDVALAELSAAGLVYRAHDDPDRWEPASTYLSGNVRVRLREANHLAATDDRYRVNVAALEAVLPEWLPAEAISARLGAVWIPVGDVRQFLVDVLGATDQVTVEHAAIVGRWSVSAPSYLKLAVTATSEWGTTEVSAYDLVEDALNLTPTVVYRRLDDGTRVKLEAETLAANDKRTALEERFAEWVFDDAERAGRLEQIYNERFNSTVLPTWDGAHLDHLPGLSAAFDPHPHQRTAVWRIMGSAGNVLLGHRVGAGKTAAMVIAGQQLRRTGQISKPLYVCSGWRRPPLAWSIRAPTAATSMATPSVNRPRIDGGRGVHPIRRGASLDAPSAGGRRSGGGGIQRAGGCRRGGLPERDGQPDEEGEHGDRPVEERRTRRTAPAVDRRPRARHRPGAPTATMPRRRTASHSAPYTTMPRPPTSANRTKAMRSHSASTPRRVGQQGGDATDDGLGWFARRAAPRADVRAGSAFRPGWGEVHDVDGTVAGRRYAIGDVPVDPRPAAGHPGWSGWWSRASCERAVVPRAPRHAARPAWDGPRRSPAWPRLGEPLGCRADGRARRLSALLTSPAGSASSSTAWPRSPRPTPSSGRHRLDCCAGPVAAGAGHRLRDRRRARRLPLDRVVARRRHHASRRGRRRRHLHRVVAGRRRRPTRRGDARRGACRSSPAWSSLIAGVASLASRTGGLANVGASAARHRRRRRGPRRSSPPPPLGRLLRRLDDERAARIREDERAILAVHLHDSVLQSLVLLQRTTDPCRMTTIARRQERELRAWLYGTTHEGEPTSVHVAIDVLAVAIEADHDVRVEAVVVGDQPLDDAARALVAAVREAVVNAARHADVERVDVFVEADDAELTGFVRDTGRGFDPAASPTTAGASASRSSAGSSASAARRC